MRVSGLLDNFVESDNSVMHWTNFPSRTGRRVITLQSTSAEQQLLPHAANAIPVAVTVEVDRKHALPVDIFLDDQPCQIEIVDEAGLVTEEVSVPAYIMHTRTPSDISPLHLAIRLQAFMSAVKFEASNLQ